LALGGIPLDAGGYHIYRYIFIIRKLDCLYQNILFEI
jgi:hypothetical protein